MVVERRKSGWQPPPAVAITLISRKKTALESRIQAAVQAKSRRYNPASCKPAPLPNPGLERLTMPTKRAAAKPAKPKKAEKPKLTAKKPATKTVAAKITAKPAAAKVTAVSQGRSSRQARRALRSRLRLPAARRAPPRWRRRSARQHPSERIVVTANGVPSAAGLSAARASRRQRR